MVYQKILVAMDQSAASELVFDRAIAIAQETGSRLKLLHVLEAEGDWVQRQQSEPDLCTYAFVQSTDAVTLVESQGALCTQHPPLERLLGCVERATAMGLEAEFTLTVGDPARVICNLARSWHADLILMGGKPHQSEPFPSSIRSYITHHAPCSVQVVKSPQFPAISSMPQVQQSDLLLAHLAGWQ